MMIYFVNNTFAIENALLYKIKFFNFINLQLFISISFKALVFTDTFKWVIIVTG